MKKCLKMFFMIVFLLGGLCFTSNVYAVTEENLNYFFNEKGVYVATKIEAESGSDITEELAEKLKVAEEMADSSSYFMVYIPSGTYYVTDHNHLVLKSYTYLVAENDTKIIKKDSENGSAIIRTRSSENATNCMIYGGTWDGNNKAKQGIEINNAKNVTIQNVNVKNCTNNGVYLNNRSTATIESCTLTNNKRNGLAIYTSSVATLKKSNISTNKEYGICISGASILKANDNANNKITYNNWSGISATGENTEILLHNNTIAYNGVEPKKSSSGDLVGHGVGVSEKAYANITNNTIQNNNQCGISVFDSAQAEISKNTICKNGRHGIGARQEITNLKLSNNNIYKNEYNGVLLSDGVTATLNLDKISSNKKNGLSVVDYSKATLTSTEICKNNDSNISISVGDAKRNNSRVTLKDGNKIYRSQISNGIVLSGKTKLEITGKNNQIYKNKKNGISSNSRSATVTITGKTKISSNSQCGIYIKASTAKISNVTVSGNTKYGVGVEGKGNLTLTSSTIKDNKNYGVNVSGSGTKAKIEKNNIYRNAKVGIMVKSKATVSSIYKNTLNNNGKTGIMIKGNSRVTSIKKNTIKNHSKYGIAIYNSKKPKMTSNKLSNPKARKQTYYKK